MTTAEPESVIKSRAMKGAGRREQPVGRHAQPAEQSLQRGDGVGKFRMMSAESGPGPDGAFDADERHFARTGGIVSVGLANDRVQVLLPRGRLRQRLLPRLVADLVFEQP